jgi:hypothetical protein
MSSTPYRPVRPLRSPGKSLQSAASRPPAPDPARPDSCARNPAGIPLPAVPETPPLRAHVYVLPIPWSPGRWPRPPRHAVRAPALTPRQMPPLSPLAPCLSQAATRSIPYGIAMTKSKEIQGFRVAGTLLVSSRANARLRQSSARPVSRTHPHRRHGDLCHQPLCDPAV